MAARGIQKELTKAEKKVRRLYALIWLLACPLAFVLARLLGFTQINIVYWTLLIVPVLLAVYNVKQVPPSRASLEKVAKTATQVDTTVTTTSTEQSVVDGVEQEGQSPEGVSHLKHAQLVAMALKIPCAIAVPILLTLIVDIIMKLNR